MTNKLVVMINSLKVPKIKNILLYEIKFLVPNYTCLQNPRLGATAPRSPFSLSSTEFVEPPLPRTKFLGTTLFLAACFSHIYPPKSRTHLTPPPRVPHGPSISLFLILSPEYLVRSTDHKAPHHVVFSTPSNLFPLRPRYIP
jgi:hypothetical protein